MGLDISSYSSMELDSTVTFDMDGEPTNIGDDWWETHAYLVPNPDFLERADGMKRGYYRFGNSMGFRAGSYGGYNRWREWLAKLAGYPPSPSDNDYHQHSQTVWNGAAGPFAELIHMSDCEGVIGPVTSAKLARDFAEFDERAKADSYPLPGFYEKYCEWRAAFEMAADGGAVRFH